MTGKGFLLNIEEYKPLRDIVFEAMREMIVSGKLAPGERLMEIQLAEEMGVSRTPVREAIRKLEIEGLVVMMPRKGTYVAGLSIKQMAEVFEIRTALEELAVQLAAERISQEELDRLEYLMISISKKGDEKDYKSVVKLDEEFHDVLFKAARNEKLSQIIGNLHEQIHRYRAASLSYPGRLKNTLEEHENIVNALAKRDADAAGKAVREHVDAAESSFMQVMLEAGNETEEEK